MDMQFDFEDFLTNTCYVKDKAPCAPDVDNREGATQAVSAAAGIDLSAQAARPNLVKHCCVGSLFHRGFILWREKGRKRIFMRRCARVTPD